MQYSQSGLKLTEQFESCRLTAYRDIKGVLTIGWGHTGSDVVEGLSISQEQADNLLLHDVQNAVNHVNHLVTIQINQNEFDALVDFAFNCGCGNFASSTLLKLLNTGNLAAAAKEFEKWDYAGGVQVAGLLRRRIAEESEFNAPLVEASN